jgi:hypothetical protein
MSELGKGVGYQLQGGYSLQSVEEPTHPTPLTHFTQPPHTPQCDMTAYLA